VDLGFIQLIDWHAGAVLTITVVTFYLFAKERLPVQSTALLALLALMLLFGIFPYRGGDRPLGPEQFLAGFGNSALVTICFLMVLGQGLVTTGALEPIVRRLVRLWSFAPQSAFLLILVFCVAVSSFVNDTPVVVLMMPVLVAIAARTGTSPSRTLLPMNYAVLIGGMATTIGTSTNLLVVGIAEKLGVPAFGLFDFFHIVAIAAGIALPYLWLVVPRLLPKNAGGRPRGEPLLFDAALQLHEKSFAVGKALHQLGKRARGLRVLQVLRGTVEMAPLPDVALRAGDRLLVRAAPEDLREYAAVLGAWLHPRERDEMPGAADQAFAQALVTGDADISGAAPSARAFADQHRLAVIGIHRARRERTIDPGETPMHPGDVVLLSGHKDRVDALRATPGVSRSWRASSLPRRRACCRWYWRLPSVSPRCC
jgi:Trk K+ transport system NAD-binding subunit